MSKPWEVNWQIHKKIGNGGQGLTYLVQSFITNEEGALKILKEQTNPAKRKRMLFGSECT